LSLPLNVAYTFKIPKYLQKTMRNNVVSLEATLESENFHSWKHFTLFVNEKFHPPVFTLKPICLRLSLRVRCSRNKRPSALDTCSFEECQTPQVLPSMYDKPPSTDSLSFQTDCLTIIFWQQELLHTPLSLSLSLSP